MFSKLSIFALIGTALAQRPSDVSICDYYTQALLKENSAANQYTLLTLVVNTAIIGNYTMPNVGISVPGILAPGEYNGTKVNLLPYFDGGFASSNQGGSSGVAVNFLDDGGAAPLLKNMPANGITSQQYALLTHLYQFFGVLLGCSLEGTSNSSFPAYSGEGSMYQVHKFMDLNPAEVGYFITQVGLSAASFGVADSDVTAVGMALAELFDYRCSPPAVVVPAQGAQLQAICTNDACSISPNASCSVYAPAMKPAVANASLVSGQGANTTTSASGRMTGTAAPTPPIAPVTAAAAQLVGGVAAAGLALLVLVL
ncbi:hypothetical protein MMC13_001459 [Lambiella insularis]|nr:hypothetical protein [Lambiella insularis]